MGSKPRVAIESIESDVGIEDAAPEARVLDEWNTADPLPFHPLPRHYPPHPVVDEPDLLDAWHRTIGGDLVALVDSAGRLRQHLNDQPGLAQEFLIRADIFATHCQVGNVIPFLAFDLDMDADLIGNKTRTIEA